MKLHPLFSPNNRSLHDAPRHEGTPRREAPPGPRRLFLPRNRVRITKLARSLLGLALAASLASSVPAQVDHFPTPIPTSGLTIGIETFATVPDASANLPARLNLLTPDPTGRLFVNDQFGPLYTINATGSEVLEYLDLRDFPELDITNNFEKGFQSFAFHPDFARPGTEGYGRFYTAHSSADTSRPADFDPGGVTSFHSLLLEWRTSTPTASTFIPADPAQPYREILRFKQPFDNHNLGLLAFNHTADVADPDYGNLYVAVADSGGGGDPYENAQNTATPYGSLLRIDPLGQDGINGHYGIVPQNVLAADGDPNTLGEIYAYGFRNPQRFGWDTLTENMFIADIGQKGAEEIDLGINGGNYGWDNREGSFKFESDDATGMIGPVAEYDHVNLVSMLPTDFTNRAITAGEVSRGTGIPGLDGLLLLSDFPTGLIFTLDVDSDPLDGGQDGLLELRPLDNNLEPRQVLDLINEVRDSRGLGYIQRADTRFGFNTPGEVYITNKQDGVIRRLTLFVEGDYDGSGRVDQEDLDLVLLHWADQGTPAPDGWLNQQPTGVIGQAELDQVLLNWGRSARGSALIVDAIPEPSSLWLGCLALLAAARLRRGRCPVPRGPSRREGGCGADRGFQLSGDGGHVHST